MVAATAEGPSSNTGLMLLNKYSEGELTSSGGWLLPHIITLDDSQQGMYLYASIRCFTSWINGFYIYIWFFVEETNSVCISTKHWGVRSRPTACLFSTKYRNICLRIFSGQISVLGLFMSQHLLGHSQASLSPRISKYSTEMYLIKSTLLQPYDQ